MNGRPRLLFAASLLVYLLVTLVMGREVLAHLSTGAMHDTGDPLLTAAILHWSATHLPLTHEWWQFPIFYPTADTLAFSEHLLGLSVVATPIEWIVDDPLAAYNLVALLTYPLCGAAMYGLVYRLTRSSSAGFVAGLAYGFAPYRVSQAPHIQMLAVFWAPLALVGLHAYLETRRGRWLVLYGAGWALQAAANGYCLIFFTVLVGLWGLWFVVARHDWQAMWRIVLATIVAVLPLAPILYKYLVVHARHGFVRSPLEMQFFSGDVRAVLCAPEMLSLWGSVRVSCRAEGELFPGVALFVLFLAGVFLALGKRVGPPAAPLSMPLRVVRVVCVLLAAAYGAAMVRIVFVGPWRGDLGSLHLTVTSLKKAATVAGPALLVIAALSARWRSHVARPPVLAFYVTAAVVTWTLSFGPLVTIGGQVTDLPGPFRLLMFMPGADGLRVPARFWMMTVLCLSIVAGLVVAELRRAGPRTSALLAGIAAIGVLSDGWVNAMPSDPIAPLPVEAAPLVGRVVLRLPVHDIEDIQSTYYAATRGWRAVNGYSGYFPGYYASLTRAVETEEDAIFQPFRERGDLDVIVGREAAKFDAVVTRQPDARLLASSDRGRHYRLPRRGRPDIGRTAGQRIKIASLDGACGRDQLWAAIDGDAQTRWICGPASTAQTIELDLGTAATVGAVVNNIGLQFDQYLRQLAVETSTDRVTWVPAWAGSLLAQNIRAGLADPGGMRTVMPFTPRTARYIRLRHPATDNYTWFIAELEVWSGNTGIPDR